MTRRFDLTDAHWTVLGPLLPAPRRPGRPSKWTTRQLLDGIRWRVRTGAPVAGRAGMLRLLGKPSTGCFAAGSATAPGHASWPPCRPGPMPPD
ncbi:transposase [Actinomadura geliboluensis]|uniref:transposase n=1 Tax=Actinomadura geliboluensis TaxID=882440 RepID=UPI003712F459